MTSTVKPIPDGYHTATPYLICDDAAKAIDFYKKAFAAVEKVRIPAPGGRIGHAEIQIGDSPIMLADEHPEIGALRPRRIGASPGSNRSSVEAVGRVMARTPRTGHQQ